MFKINIQDKFERDDEKEDQVQLQVSTNSITTSFYRLFKYSQFIQEEFKTQLFQNFLSTKIEYCLQNADIKKENIELFFKILNEEEVQIEQNQYCDLCKLSSIFKVKPLEKLLIKYSQDHSNDSEFLIHLILENEKSGNLSIISNDVIHYDIENCIKSNINNCLANKNFSKIQISTIHRIMSQIPREKIDSNLLYDFIKELIEQRCVLLSFLEIENLSDEKFDDLCQNYCNKSCVYCDYLPNNLMFIKKLKENQKNLEKQIKKLSYNNEKIIAQKNELESKYNESIASNKQIITKFNELERKYNESMTINKQIIAQKNGLERKYNESIASIRQIIAQKNELESKYNESILSNKKIITKNNELEIKNKELQDKYKEIEEQKNNELKKLVPSNDRICGIINQIRNNTNNKIENEIHISSSSSKPSSKPINVSTFDNQNIFFESKNQPNSWICFDFQKHRIIPTYYQIKSFLGGPTAAHPRSWVIEVSNDNNNWINIDTQNNCSYLKGSRITHKFKINKNITNEYRYLRMVQTGKNWHNDDRLIIETFEIYGKLF